MDIWWGNQREIGRKIGRVFWLGKPMEIGGNKGKKERERKRAKEREKRARLGEPTGAISVAPPLETE